jgi:anti-sigma regulatory factor (Ser/Thr protein kinase)
MARSRTVPDGEPNPRGVSCALDRVPTRVVRRLVRDMLAGHSGITVDDAVLVADELVTNALRHGRAIRTCRLALVDRRPRLRIEIDDTSPEEPRIRTPDDLGGRGLVLVDRLASSWGVDHHDDHKTVWAELTLDMPGGSRHIPHLAATRTWERRHR